MIVGVNTPTNHDDLELVEPLEQKNKWRFKKSYAQIELTSSIFLLDSMYKNKYFVKSLILQKWTEKRIAVKMKLPDLLNISAIFE